MRLQQRSRRRCSARSCESPKSSIGLRRCGCNNRAATQLRLLISGTRQETTCVLALFLLTPQVHCVQAPGSLSAIVRELAPFPAGLLLHGFSGSAETASDLAGAVATPPAHTVYRLREDGGGWDVVACSPDCRSCVHAFSMCCCRAWCVLLCEFIDRSAQTRQGDGVRGSRQGSKVIPACRRVNDARGAGTGAFGHETHFAPRPFYLHRRRSLPRFPLTGSLLSRTPQTDTRGRTTRPSAAQSAPGGRRCPFCRRPRRPVAPQAGRAGRASAAGQRRRRAGAGTLLPALRGKGTTAAARRARLQEPQRRAGAGRRRRAPLSGGVGRRD